MTKKEQIKILLASIESKQPGVVPDADVVIANFPNRSTSTGSIAIRILSMLGIVIGSLLFLGFLFLSGVSDSPGFLVVLGMLLVITIVASSRYIETLLMDTAAVSFYLIGLLIIVAGCSLLHINDTLNAVFIIMISFVTLCVVRKYLIAFVATLALCGSIATLFLVRENPNLVYIESALLVTAMVFMFMNEARIRMINSTVSELYNPVRMGLMVSYLTLLALMSVGLWRIDSGYYGWISSVVTIGALFWLAQRLIDLFKVVRTSDIVLVYAIALLMLLPTVAAPGISGALLIILLSFYVSHNTGLVLGIAGLLYFLGRFYYDLSISLLLKSVFLMSAGGLFLVFFFLTSKKLSADEKN